MIVKKFISVLLCSFKVPEHIEITESLAKKLHRLAQLNVRMGRLRERVQFYTNVSQFARLGGHVQANPAEYRLYVAEMDILQRLTTAMWVLQDEIDDLQSQIMNMIYGSGGNAN